MQQTQAVSLLTHYQTLTDNAKLYEPGECYADFVRNLPKNLHKEPLHSDSTATDNTRYQPSCLPSPTHSCPVAIGLQNPHAALHLASCCFNTVHIALIMRFELGFTFSRVNSQHFLKNSLSFSKGEQ